MTQKHMLISLEEGIIQWFKLELPEVVLGEKDNSDRSLKVLEEIEQEFALNMTIGESDEPEYIAHMHYAKSFTQLIMATETGVLGRLEVEAEAINYDEDEEGKFPLVKSYIISRAKYEGEEGTLPALHRARQIPYHEDHRHQGAWRHHSTHYH